MRLVVAIAILLAPLAMVAIGLAVPPNPSFNISNTSPTTGEPVTFTSLVPDPGGNGNAIAAIQWDFGDGTGDSGQTVSHSFDTPGQKTVRMTVTDVLGDVVEATRELTVDPPPNQAPTASFTFSPPAPREDQTVTFDASASSDPDGDDVTYAWDFDGDGFDDGASATATHAFSSHGPHTVALRVSDGQLDGDTSQVVTVNAEPHARFDAIPAVPLVGATFTLDASDSSDPDGGAPVAYEWDLDDDGRYDGPADKTGAQVTHSFSSRGTKTITLRVTDAGGAQDEKTDTVRINAPPIAKIAFSPQAPTKDQPVALSGEKSSDTERSIAAYDWDLDGDGQFDDARGKNATKTFSAPGIQRASLRVTDSDGATAVETVRINRKPVAAFISNNETPITNEAITFAQTATDIDGDNTITGNGLGPAFAWDLDGDGQFDDGTGGNVTHAFASAGTHTVRLRVIDDLGASEVAALPVQVENTRPNAAFSFTPEAPLPGQLVTLASTSSATPGKDLVKWEWDLDNDRQYDDASGPSVGYSFASPGVKTVALRVEERGGGIDITSGFVIVNAAPTASFTSSPGNAFVGDGMTFSSTSADPDGPLAAQQWDLDNDGEFDDAAGETATRAFGAAGAHTVRLRVTDSRGAVATASGTVTVIARPLTVLRLPWEFGVGVRRIAPFTTRVKLLAVRAPSGASVTVRCLGRSCPDGNLRRKGRQQMRISTRGRGARKLRFRRLERPYRSGTKIVVSATKLGFIGKQQTWTIRRRRSPLHREQCVYPGTTRATACPES